MSHHNQPPKAEREPFQYPERVQYRDGSTGFGYRTPGDRVVLGGAGHKHASNFFSADMAWITTESGNRYGIGYGLVYNRNTKEVYELPTEPVELTIGAEGEIVGVGTTSPVQTVLIRYKDMPLGDPNFRQVADVDSPWKEFDAAVAPYLTIEPIEDTSNH